MRVEFATAERIFFGCQLEILPSKNFNFDAIK
jgi:hypothetical protein